MAKRYKSAKVDAPMRHLKVFREVTEHINTEFDKLINETCAHFIPRGIRPDDVIKFCVQAEDIPALERAYALAERNLNYTQRMSMVGKHPSLPGVKIYFRVPTKGAHNMIVVPDYALYEGQQVTIGSQPQDFTAILGAQLNEWLAMASKLCMSKAVFNYYNDQFFTLAHKDNWSRGNIRYVMPSIVPILRRASQSVKQYYGVGNKYYEVKKWADNLEHVTPAWFAAPPVFLREATAIANDTLAAVTLMDEPNYSLGDEECGITLGCDCLQHPAWPEGRFSPQGLSG